MWMGGFIPQIIVSLVLAAWLTNTIVKVKGAGAIKILTYMPNIITAASVSVLFNALFAQYGPITLFLKKIGVLASDFNFMYSVGGARGIISFILFWMWYGNTTLLLISGMMGINPSLYEAAAVSVMLFIITLIVSMILFKSMEDKDAKLEEKQKKMQMKAKTG